MKKCYQCGKTEGKLVRVPHKTGWWCVEHAYAERQDAAEHGYSWPSTCPRCQGWSETGSFDAVFDRFAVDGIGKIFACALTPLS